MTKKLSHPEGWGTFQRRVHCFYFIHEWNEEKSKPPTRIKEARLLSLMEKAGKDIEDEDLAEAMAGKGLGTPATRADTIEKLLSEATFHDSNLEHSMRHLTAFVSSKYCVESQLNGSHPLNSR